MNHQIRMRSVYYTISCALKEIWAWIQYMTFTEKSRKCNESSEEVWQDFSASYQYDEDYKHISEEKGVQTEDNKLTVRLLSCFFIMSRLSQDYLLWES